MLEVRHLFKSYAGKPVLRDVSFSVGQGETVCLLGASGSGKSTLLRIIAGLENADSGFVSFAGEDLSSTPAHLRDFGLVFQDYALFPHLDVSENVAFGLRRSVRRLPANEVEKRIATTLNLVNLQGFEKRQVTDLSGGEQQRVALARALAIRPRLLMFDEPLGALDRTLREDLLDELRSILSQTSVPAIYVTHDQEEAFAIADRMLILHDGEIIRDGTPAEVWAAPGSALVAGFLGLGNVFTGEVQGKHALSTREGTKEASWEVESDFGTLSVRCTHEHRKGDRVHLLVRPHPDDSQAGQSADARPADRRNLNKIQGWVTGVIFQKERFKITMENGLYFYRPAAPKAGESIEVSVTVECLG